MANEGTFREDLYYRLHVVPVSIPPLRERRDDILPLVQHFLNENNHKYQISKSFDRSLKEFFYQHDWPGNVRELANLVERLMLTVPTNELQMKDLPDDYRKAVDNIPYVPKELETSNEIKTPKEKRTIKEIGTLKAAVEQAEREVLSLAAQQFQTTYEIAEHLATSQATIVRKLQKYKIKPIDTKMN
ncbi:hypothetical protein [Alkalihalobacterium chitinilyticum]|uniref:Sigma-54 factor interaction domain-containing protein n=1 Tax=Alkalihalobacterium chitinilyticum TaxID=2980103 RepID=A0ABT5VKX5_9BACI|nr:hypothetical protein [Alkalihalobacterium chitinilyticum]MDE5415108.1 hypothetical protein [Alkalihalobacterium chitinilyticum]